MIKDCHKLKAKKLREGESVNIAADSEVVLSCIEIVDDFPVVVPPVASLPCSLDKE